MMAMFIFFPQVPYLIQFPWSLLPFTFHVAILNVSFIPNRLSSFLSIRYQDVPTDFFEAYEQVKFFFGGEGGLPNL
jgi:hypothetical protein